LRSIWDRPGSLASGSLSAGTHPGLAPDPFDQLIELDRLLGSNQGVEVRKSVFTGGFIAAMSAVIVGLLVGGPVGRFKGSAGRDGVSLEAERHK